MKLLPYCIASASELISAPATGVRGASIQSLQELGLQCFYSSMGEAPSPTEKDALEFHRALSAIFEQVAVIPFRFPTLVGSASELKDFLREHASVYNEPLARLRDTVQMELHISIVPPQTRPVMSGKRYLEERSAALHKLRECSQQARNKAVELIRDWRCRDSPQPDLLRCYALISRDAVAEFRDWMRRLTPGDGVKVEVSGPWPAMEFMTNEKMGP